MRPAEKVLQKLLRKEFVSDPEFDGFLNVSHRLASNVHWTSVEVAKIIIKMVALSPSDHVLDVGSGVGKLSFLLSLYADCYVTGVEQRQHLVKVAQSLKRILRLNKVAFFHADALELDWVPYNIIYLFNPFQEHLPDEGTPKLDETIEFDEAEYRYYVEQTQKKLSLMPMFG